MSKVRVLVDTRKGAFILTDGKREKWDVTGPHFAGWEMYHLKASPVDELATGPTIALELEDRGRRDLRSACHKNADGILGTRFLARRLLELESVLSQRGKYEDQTKHGMRSSHGLGACHGSNIAFHVDFCPHSSRTDFLRRTTVQAHNSHAGIG